MKMTMISLFSRDRSASKDDLKMKVNSLKKRYDEMLIRLNTNPPKDFKKGYKDLLLVGAELSNAEALISQ